MPNQQLISTINVAVSVDRKLPGQDSQNVDNILVSNTDTTGAANDPKSFPLLPSTNKVINFLPAKGVLLVVKSDSPIGIKFGANQKMTVGSFFAMDGDHVGLGALTIYNDDTVNTANVQVLEVGQ